MISAKKCRKKNSMKKLIAFVAIIFFLASCKKNISELPEAPGTGSENFGASVNGKLWTPQKFGIMPSAQILEARYEPGNSVVINARNFASSPNESEFELVIKNITGSGVYLFNPESGSSAYYVERKLTPTGEWKTNAQYTGKVTITVHDLTNKILAGTFEFQAASLYNAAPITVTNGRFDVKVQ
jgi:hypothetical protein